MSRIGCVSQNPRANGEGMVYQTEVNNQQSSLPVDGDRLRRAVETILAEEGIERAMINIAVVDDATIHDLNRRFLNHDEPTDVLSFPLGDEAGRLEGDIIVSADTAVRTAAHVQWPAADEVLLYVVHGILHLVGYDDVDSQSRTEMHARQRHYMCVLGVQPPTDWEGDFDERSPATNPELTLARKS